jgi:uncharacterized membrane protein
VTLFAIGMIGLGILGLIYGDFAMVWQPVAAWVPGRTAIAYAFALLMLAGGVGLLLWSTAALAVRLLFPYFIVWTLLEVPAIFAAPKTEGVYLGIGELGVLLAGGWILFARLAGLRHGSPLTFAVGDRGVRIARFLFAVSLLPIGLSHIVYVQATADLVPAWLPYRSGWAYLTGAGQMACGLGVLLSILPRVAAWCEAGMLTCFTLLVWVPVIVNKSKERLSWTAFFISWAIMSAAWVVASDLTTHQSASRDG